MNENMQNNIAGDFANLMGQSRINQLGGRFINGRPLPLQTRRRIVEMHRSGVKPCKISRDLQVSHGAVSKILNRFAETGSIAPGQIGGNPRSRLAVQSVQGHIFALKRAAPDISAAEICEALVAQGICTRENVPTICSVNRHLRSRGLKQRRYPHSVQQKSSLLSCNTIIANSIPCTKELSDETCLSECGSGIPSSSSSSSYSHLSLDINVNIVTDDGINHNNIDVDVFSVSDDENEITNNSLSHASKHFNDEKVNGKQLDEDMHRTSEKSLTYGISAILGEASTTNFDAVTKTDETKNQISMSHIAGFPSSSDEENPFSFPKYFSKNLTFSASEVKSEQPKFKSSFSNLETQAKSKELNFLKWADSTGGLGEYRRNRTSFSSQQLQVLEASFAKERYPTEEEKIRLMECTMLDEDKIITWFSNRRARNRRQWLQNLTPDIAKWIQWIQNQIEFLRNAGVAVDMKKFMDYDIMTTFPSQHLQQIARSTARVKQDRYQTQILSSVEAAIAHLQSLLKNHTQTTPQQQATHLQYDLNNSLGTSYVNNPVSIEVLTSTQNCLSQSVLAFAHQQRVQQHQQQVLGLFHQKIQQQQHLLQLQQVYQSITKSLGKI